MKKYVILDDCDIAISIPKARKTVIIQNKEVYITEANDYPGDIEFTKLSDIEKIKEGK